MAATAVTARTVGSEVQITHEDQKMINTFANKNAKHTELKASVANKKKELQNLEDAGDELMVLDDDSGTIPVHIGEVFLHLSMDEAQEYIDSTKEGLEKEVKDLDGHMSKYEVELKDLKVKLYATFGTNINLEEDDES